VRTICKMTFAEKVHHILSNPDVSNLMRWETHGRAFRVSAARNTEIGKVLFRYFGHKRHEQFIHDLQSYGFKLLCAGPYKGCYYHEVRSSTCKLLLSANIALWTNSEFLLLPVHASGTSSPLQVNACQRREVVEVAP
jgi:hypothetical protein